MEIRPFNCKRCGACCTVIVMSYFTVRLYKRKKEKGDLGFVANNWKEINRSKAFRLNPHLRIVCHNREDKHVRFFICKRFNKEKRLCRIHYHGKKPIVCKDYPVYGDRNFKGTPANFAYSPNCGFVMTAETIQEIERCEKKIAQGCVNLVDRIGRTG